MNNDTFKDAVIDLIGDSSLPDTYKAAMLEQLDYLIKEEESTCVKIKY